MKALLRRTLLLGPGLSLILLGGLAFGSRAGDDRAKAESAVAALSANAAHRRIAHEAVHAAEHALRRADEARAAGDQKHATELDALAREHAETGVDLGRAAEAEKKLTETQRELTQIETKITRARAVLEETLARRGRAQAKLDELERRAQAPPVAPAPVPKSPQPKAPRTKPAGKGKKP